MDVYTIISLALYFALMMGIGLYAYKTSTESASDFLLGGRQLHPVVGALSAGASDMSGWMLMGLPGAIFLTGMSSTWIAVGLLIGAFANYKFVAPRLRVYTEVANDAITIPDFFEERFNDTSHILRVLSSVVIIIFFTLYTSAGVVAGGKFFEASFGLDYGMGILVTAGVVILYTMIGGFLAVSLTDFVQGCIMFIALILVPLVAMMELGGLGNTMEIATIANPNALDWFGGATVLGVISAMAWGLGYFGQPHIIVRFMAIRSVKDIAVARHVGMSWMFITLIGAVTTGLFGLAYVTEKGIPLDDAETIFIALSQILFHPLITGFLLAAILAAIMSTISSQLLVSSSSLSEDFYKTFIRPNAGQKELVMISRAAILVVSALALLLALDQDNSILSLVANAWAGFGAAFGPLVILSLFWKGMTRNGALACMIVGAVTVLVWVFAPITIGGQSLPSIIYEIVPGFVMATLAAVVVSKMSSKPDDQLLEHFSKVEDIIAAEVR